MIRDLGPTGVLLLQLRLTGGVGEVSWKRRIVPQYICVDMMNAVLCFVLAVSCCQAVVVGSGVGLR